MEESTILENREKLPADKMKAPNAHGEIKELIPHEPSDQDEVLKTDPVTPSAEKELEAKKGISPEAVANTSSQKQTLPETVTVKTPNTEKNIQEANSKGNSTETSLKSQAPAKEQNGAKESTEAKDKTSNLKSKPPIEDPQVTETTKADQEQKESKNASQKKDKSKNTKASAAKKAVIKEDQATTPKDKLDTQEKESDGKEILLEQDRRKTWRSLLAEVSLVSSLSTFRLLYDKSSALESSDASVRRRNAKQLYKKKVKILRENYTYRLGLLKQLKEAMRDKYNSEAQQLYSDYTSSKRKHRSVKNTDTHAEDSKESKATDPSGGPVALATLG